MFVAFKNSIEDFDVHVPRISVRKRFAKGTPWFVAGFFLPGSTGAPMSAVSGKTN